VSYIITHKLERFPEKGEQICFPIQKKDEKDESLFELCFMILEIEDSTIGTIEVSKRPISEISVGK
jgi:hypothetical protein